MELVQALSRPRLTVSSPLYYLRLVIHWGRTIRRRPGCCCIRDRDSSDVGSPILGSRPFIPCMFLYSISSGIALKQINYVDHLHFT